MTKQSLALDVEMVGRIAAIPSILELVCKMTGLRFAAVARVTDERWIACAVRDGLAFGLVPGGELELETTICHEIRQSGNAVIIDHVSEDPHFCTHHTPKQYGFESYISVPIWRGNGEFFGTLCALDPRPARLSDPKVLESFELFCQLISLQLEAEEKLAQSEAALLDQAQTAELREQFIAVLGHDLRTPLQSVQLGVQVLAGMELGAKAASVLARVTRSAERMGLLVDDVMDFARGRLGAGIPVQKSDGAALEATLRHVVAELASAHPGRPVELDLALAQPVPCDVARLGQLLSNLLGNALVHGAQGEPVLVRARAGAGVFTLSVRNKGEPLTQGVRQRLFQPFSRRSSDERGKGLGLGLYIASQVARAHGGSLRVESTPEATTFTLEMPAGPSA